jgi:uncharacterized membrane protein
MTVLDQIFSYVCRSPNIWAPGGEALPFCQRCTGLYVGCLLALVLCAVFRPRPTWPVVSMHGLLLVLMVPFGYHLVPQNAVIRMLSGQLFAFGLVYYLALNAAGRFNLWKENSGENVWGCVLWALAGITALQVAVQAGGLLTGAVLSWLGLAGLLGYAALVIANLALLPPAILGILRRQPAVSRSIAS